jgi:hypothetical protein
MSARQSTITRRTSPIETWAERSRRAAAIGYRPRVRRPRGCESGLEVADIGAAAAASRQREMRTSESDSAAAMKVESRPHG